MSKPTEDPYQLWHGTNNENPHDTFSQVLEFEQACGATLYAAGEAPPIETLKLRLSLELEELYEKAQAMGLEGTFCAMLDETVQKHFIDNPENTDYLIVPPDTNTYDPVALLDACCDQRYVQDGTMLTCGLDKAFPEAFAEVQRSNMSKFPDSYELAQDTAYDYRREGVDTYLVGNSTSWIVKRVPDGKILKSRDYSPANLAPILAKYTQP